MAEKIKILFVCMGNICRSPTAHGVFRTMVELAELGHLVEIDSAGTHSYHVGKEPDPRAREVAELRGYDMSNLQARRVTAEDCEQYDYVIAMDEENLMMLQELCPDGHEHKLCLFLDFSADSLLREVPDPYYGGKKGFERVLDLVEDASKGLLQHIVREHFCY